MRLNELIKRATGGDDFNQEETFRPSWVYHLTDDPFWVWCEHHAPESENVDETTLYDEHRMQEGIEWERKWVDTNYPDAYEVEEQWGLGALKETLQAMLDGETAIHSGTLLFLSEDLHGKTDLLVRSDAAPSDLGDYHYEVKEIKNSSSLKDYHELQCGLYNKILGSIQGYTPEHFEIVLNEETGQQQINYSNVQDEVDNHLSYWREIRDNETKPEPAGIKNTSSPWRKYVDSHLKENGDLTLLPGVGPSSRETIKKKDIQSIDDILELGEQGAIDVFGEDGKHYYWHSKAYEKGEPIFAPDREVEITRRERIAHFDVETTTVEDSKTISRSHTYMLGVALPDGSTKIWTAEGQDDEKRMWADFLEWLGDPSEVALYCWTMYEEGQIENAAEDHPELANQLNEAKKALIDLKEEVKHQPYFPVPTHSIKSVAPTIGFNWSQDDVDGLSAGVLYKQWLETGDDSIIEKVEQYNREDVLAMLAIDEWIQENAPELA